MGRCGTIVVFNDGVTVECGKETTRYSTSCYLHEKYWQGLCEPTMRDNENGMRREDEVSFIKHLDGRSKCYQ